MKIKTILSVVATCCGIAVMSWCLGGRAMATSINLSVDSSTVAFDLASSSINGNFGESAAMTISVATDNPSGYYLSISGPNGTSLKNDTDVLKTISSIDEETTASNFAAELNTSYNNKWGYKPSKINGVDNNNFLPAPSAEGDVIDTVWHSNDTSNQYTVSIGARINSETTPGNYSNTFVITAVPNPPLLAVIYEGNGLYYDDDSTSISNTVLYDAKSSTVGDVTTYTKTVIDGSYKTPSNSNIEYKFRGWSEDPNATEATYLNEASVITDLEKVNGDPGVTLYAVWSRVYTLQYDGNGADNLDGMGSTDASTGIKSVNHSNVALGDTFDLFASNFKRDGYGFAGWSLDADAWEHLADNDNTNDPIIYGPNEMITAPAYQSDIMTLNAVWVPAETVADERVMLQNWSGCAGLTATTYDSASGKLTVSKESITALTDQRDGQTYAVARLADENCWLIENLRLDNTSELSTDNTNIDSTNSSLPLTNIFNSNPSLATTSNHLSQPSNRNASGDYNYGWCSQYSENCLNQSRLNTSAITSNVIPTKTQNISSSNDHMDFGVAYSYGNYYNWYSATAGYGLYSTTSAEPTVGDICPAGWHLPYGSNGSISPDIGGTSGGFAYLDSQIGGTGSASSTIKASNNWRVFPNNFIYSGYVNSGSAYSSGGYGAYWSSSANNNNTTYYLQLLNNSVGSGTNNFGKYLGLTVRCVVGE